MSARPELFRVAVHVTDIAAAVSGYELVLGVDADRVGEGRSYFPSDAAILVCVDPEVEGHGVACGPNTGTVYFAVADLERRFELMHEAGFETIDEPRVRAWGERSFYARDPFGNPLCFVDTSTRYTGSSRKATAKK